MPKPHTCLRCGHEWIPRRRGATLLRPAVCPNPTCRSPRWDRPRAKMNHVPKGTPEEKVAAGTHHKS